MNPDLIENIPRLHTALAEWLACLVYVMQLPRRRRAPGCGAAPPRFWRCRPCLCS